MSYRNPADNIYPEGIMVTANVNPSVKLVIIKYMQRIYYCSVAGEENGKQLAYFEREITPVNVLTITR
jgi:hypothetical protein